MQFPLAVVGLLGLKDSGVEQFLAMAPLSYQLDGLDAIERLAVEREIEAHRRAGRAIAIGSHDQNLLRSLADEIWWIRSGVVAAQGHPSEVLGVFQQFIADQQRESARQLELTPAMRRGDGRAEILDIELSAPVVRSGEMLAISVTVRFHADVADPVLGIMIRTRIGFEVYGTNTELEKVHFGPCRTGEVVTVRWEMRCLLCAQAYTITAASHDPDGVWHDWMEDAVLLQVVDERYTAGVANLRAAVTISRPG